MFVCICARVRECDVRGAIRCGARSEDAVGDACGAGTGCGTCLDRICELIIEEMGLSGRERRQVTTDALAAIAR